MPSRVRAGPRSAAFSASQSRGLLFGGLVAAFGAEDMRVAGDHLVGDRADDVGEGEEAGLGGHLGVVDGLEQEVAQLAREARPRPARSMASATSCASSMV